MAEIGGQRFDWGSRTYVMGIVNVTPDSFSGDGIGGDDDAAVSQGLRMVKDGADLLDVGGESTRPGHVPVTVAEEIARTESVVRRLARESGVPVSIDTYKREVADFAVAAGATILNDIWGLARSPELAEVAARHGCGLVLMHNQDGTEYAGDLMEEIKRFLGESVSKARAAGVAVERIIVDPGIGFGKTADQNWEVMRRFGELKDLGQPILVGTSRSPLSASCLIRRSRIASRGRWRRWWRPSCAVPTSCACMTSPRCREQCRSPTESGARDTISRWSWFIWVSAPTSARGRAT
jgi:dihydropteroate synthase